MEKKWIVLSMILIIGYSISISGKKGEAENVVITVGKSETFKYTEIETAMNYVKNEFKGFTNCELTKLYYNEEKSNMEIKNYFIENQEIERIKNTDKNDFIVLYSDFDVGLEEDPHSSFMPGANYKGWMWLLRKGTFLKKWQIVRSGV
ncbi:hypothetical protein [Candidatus Enterococcus mansonii]|uniref:DUF4829 domain-containing protein n=1 Tax=Candidatus Enterococcus mansonii TaxID=1834181 RepID=A0A242CHU1_9ENTE|nr:hypothetical protein [Enterococcus sp. 4G2_DIV0659]OTO09813.1 hypothetical protein A5880_000496 [Enterococcus sp. 4G2_DIV0659]